MPHFRLAAALVTALSLLALPRVAQAGPSELPTVTDDPDDEPKEDPQLERAMKAYELGQAAYNAADYDAALGHFQEAASLYGSPDFQYNIGLCYEKLDKPEEAIRAFEVYLRAKPTAEDRAQVEDRIAEQRERLATKQQGGSDDASDGDDRDPPPPPPGKNDGRALVISGAVLLGVGAALGLAGGIGFGVAAKRRSDDLDDVQSGGNPGDVTFAEAQDLESEGKRFETLQIATAAVGAAIGITGVVLLAIGLKRKQAAGASALRFSPHLGKGTAGLSLGGRF